MMSKVIGTSTKNSCISSQPGVKLISTGYFIPQLECREIKHAVEFTGYMKPQIG
jgi:hypothetical protein